MAPQKCYRKDSSQGGAALAHCKVRKKGGLGDRIRVRLGELPLPTAPLNASLFWGALEFGKKKSSCSARGMGLL